MVKKIILVLVFVAANCFAFAQNMVIGKDTTNTIYGKALHYIYCNLIELSINDSLVFSKSRKKIFYRTFENSTILYENIVKSPPFKSFFAKPIKDSVFLFKCVNFNLYKHTRRFQNLSKLKEPFVCFDLFPIVNKFNHFYLKIMYTKYKLKTSDEVFISFLIFDKQMNISQIINNSLIID